MTNTIRQNVEWILSKSEKCRNDDKYLLLIYWNKINGIKLNDNPNLAEDLLEKGQSASSIIRARSLIQSEGHYPPTAEVALRRRSKEANMRSAVINGQVAE